MTVFKTFLKILNKNKFIVILYTVILIGFGGINLQTSDNSTNFVATKPDVLIINYDVDEGITKSLIDYITKNSNIIEIDNEEEKINDAIFYRDINYVIYIPENFREDFLQQKNPKIEVKSTGDYQSSLTAMHLDRYMSVANTYNAMMEDEEEIINNIGVTLAKEVEIEMTSKLDTAKLSKATFYYNFASYSILAGCVYILCLILSSFKNEKIQKRTIISSMNYKKLNRELLLANGLFAFVLWLFYILLSIVLLEKIMFTMQGFLYIINSFVFSICALTIAFLIGNLVHNKNAINGIVNVVALGSSFLCGAFVPMEWLPDSVLKLAHVLPSYYYISSNELIGSLEIFNFTNLKPILINICMLILFIILFIVLTNIVSKRKRVVA